jgi:hypothetical protein
MLCTFLKTLETCFLTGISAEIAAFVSPQISCLPLFSLFEQIVRSCLPKKMKNALAGTSFARLPQLSTK